MRKILKKLVVFSFFCTGFALFGDGSVYNFSEANQSTTTTLPYIPRQSEAAIQNGSDFPGAVTVTIKQKGGAYGCELKYFPPDEKGEGVLRPKSLWFGRCSDAAIITTNQNNFFQEKASVNTYLITASYADQAIWVYKVNIVSGRIVITALNHVETFVYTLPPSLTGFVSGSQVATYLTAVADHNSDQAGFYISNNQDDRKGFAIGHKSSNGEWSLTRVLEGDNVFENYFLYLRENSLRFTAVDRIEGYPLKSRSILDSEWVNGAFENSITIFSEMYNQQYPYSRNNELRVDQVLNDRFYTYRNPLGNALVYRLKPGENAGVKIISISNVTSIDSSAFNSKLETVIAKEFSGGTNPVVTDYEDVQKDFDCKASPDFDNQSKQSFIENLVIKVKVSFNNVKKGIFVWVQSAKTKSGNYVSFLVYVFTKVNSEGQLEKDSEVVYTSPIGEDSALNQINTDKVPAEEIPKDALDSNTEAKDVTVIALPVKDNNKPVYLIRLVTYLKDKNTYSEEFLSGTSNKGLRKVDALIQLVDTYVPVKTLNLF